MEPNSHLRLGICRVAISGGGHLFATVDPRGAPIPQPGLSVSSRNAELPDGAEPAAATPDGASTIQLDIGDLTGMAIFVP